MIYRSNEQVFVEKEVRLEDGSTFPVLAFADWECLPGIRHCFSTREGGVSEGFLASLNFRRDLYDPPENIRENFRRMAVYFGTTPDRIVCAKQTHTANVRIVTEEDAGKGVTRERDYTDVDGLITNVPGLLLFTSHADCVPLYFYDPERRVIALSHSGWKGTVSRIGAVTVRLMQEAFGCDPARIHAAVGPSICADCYEVSEDVAGEFQKCFGEGSGSRTGFSPAGTGAPEKMRAPEYDSAGTDPADPFSGIPSPAQIPRILRSGKTAGKYQLDLWEANARILREAGIDPAHITVTNLCTCENPGSLFSHRATAGRRGLAGAFLMMEP